jgi:hypothetical protein
MIAPPPISIPEIGNLVACTIPPRKASIMIHKVTSLMKML